MPWLWSSQAGEAANLGRSHTPSKHKMKLGSGPQCHASVRLPFFLGVGVALLNRALVTLSGTLYQVSGKCHRPPQASLGLTQSPTVKLPAGDQPGSLPVISLLSLGHGKPVCEVAHCLSLPTRRLSHLEVGHRAPPCLFPLLSRTFWILTAPRKKPEIWRI